jgi:pimeloyl-ACP methyl ester carboxylesterase
MRTKLQAPTTTTGSVISADGTVIGYRRFGQGPGLALVHGGLMASQNFTKLAEALAGRFTVYVPDRRGRGMSGPYTDDHCARKEVEDLHALVTGTDTHFVFALSAGAVTSLEAARHLSEIHKLALYEPPLSFSDSSSVDWVPRYEREMAAGKLGAAFATIVKGTKSSRVMGRIPRFLLTPLLGLALKANAKEVKDGDVAIRELIPTMHYDASVVAELADSLATFRDVRIPVLLLRGAKSANYLHLAYDRLAGVLPDVRCVEIPGVGHLAADNDGKPELVAIDLCTFFSDP